MGMIQEFQQADAERRREVASMRSEVATVVRDFAAQAPERKATVAFIANEADTLVKDFIKGSAQRRSEVATVVRDFAAQASERKAAVAAIHEMVWGKVPAKKIAAPPEEAVVQEVSVDELRDKVFAYLADHPDGTKLVELEEKFGMPRIQMARVLRALIDDNKVEKRDLLYFAI